MCLELREIDVGVSQIISEVMGMLDFLGKGVRWWQPKQRIQVGSVTKYATF